MLDTKLIEELLQKTQEEIRKMNPCNILLVGKTGVGKSTLINAVFREELAETGIGHPVTQNLERISHEEVPLVLYDTKGYELSSESQEDIEKGLFSFLNEIKAKRDQIHLVYYCIHGLSSRIEDKEIEIIKKLGEKYPVIIVLTQSIGENPEKLKDYIESLHLNVEEVIMVLAKDYKVTGDLVIESFGLEKLLEVSFRHLPEEVQNSFSNAQKIDVEEKVRRSKKWANRYVKSAFGVGFVPIPFSDASLLVPMQVTMLAHITAIFGISMSRSRLLSIIAAVGGTSGATVLGRGVVSNLIKFIPGLGSLAGGLISATTASAITKALANAYIEALAFLARKENQGEEIDFSLLEDIMKDTFASVLNKEEKEQ